MPASVPCMTSYMPSNQTSFALHWFRSYFLMPAGEGEHKGYSIKQSHPIEADCSVEVNPIACFALLPVTQVPVAHANRQPNSSDVPSGERQPWECHRLASSTTASPSSSLWIVAFIGPWIKPFYHGGQISCRYEIRFNNFPLRTSQPRFIQSTYKDQRI
jgi:hypothetical protein